MNLKTLWGALCDCFVTKTDFNSLFDTRLSAQKAFISNQSMPNGEPIYIASANGDRVAPSDGFYCLQATGATSNGASIQLNANGFMTRIVAAAASQSLCVFLPVKKGQPMSNYQEGFSTSTLTFISTIGGGA